MCNVTYRLEKIDRLILFELVNTQITVNISYLTNCANPDIIESHNRIFPICLIVTSHSPFFVEFILIGMLGVKEKMKSESMCICFRFLA